MDFTSESLGGGEVELELLARYNALSKISDADQKTRSDAIQEISASCMEAKGFTYYPVDIRFDVSKEPLNWNMDYFSNYGHGVSIEPPPPPPREPDPNAEYRSTLSAEALIEYDIALDGDPGLGEAEGCLKEAAREVPAPAAPRSDLMDSIFSEVARRLEHLESSDPSYLTARQDFIDCMADVGVPDYDMLALSSGYIAEKWEELQAGSPSQQEIEKFQDWEREVAMTEFRCGEEYGKARALLEQTAQVEVVREHKAEIEAYLVAAEVESGPTPRS